MADMAGLLREYTHMRGRGITAMEALEFLRLRIERLPANDRAEIVRQIRAHEVERASTAPEPIKPLNSMRQSNNTTEVVAVQSTGEQISCPNCGKPNGVGDLFCFSCGYVLMKDKVSSETKRLSDVGGMSPSEHFDPQSALVLVLRSNNQQFRLRPQDLTHEVILGRADQAFAPDVDLSKVAGNMSVSRIHMCIRYQPETQTLTATDLNSANGTFINGQRLYPKEVRTLRHGDELRLGQMAFNVYYQR